MGKVALFGGGGVIGQSIAAALRKRGKAYRVVGRSRSTLETEFGNDPLAEIVTWEPDNSASVRTAARGIDTIIYLIGVPYNKFPLHPVLIRKTLEGAIAEKVPKFVLIGTVYPYGLPQTPRVSENHPRNPHTFKGKMRKEQEDILLAADAAGSIQGTILKLPDFYGPNVKNSFMYQAFQAAVTGKRAQLLGPIDTPHEFIYVPDTGPVVLALANDPRAFGRAWNLAGAGTITQKEFVTRIYKEAGQKLKYFVAGKTLLRIMGLFNPIMRELVEMHYLQTTPLILDDTALHSLLGSIHKTSYDDGIRQTLAAAKLGSKSATDHN